MKTYLLSLIIVSSLCAGTYDNMYVPKPLYDLNTTQKEDPFMDGAFIEIKRFNAIDFSDGDFEESSEETLITLFS